MSKLHEARFKPRGELEAPPAFRKFDSVVGYLRQFKFPFQRKKAVE